MYNSNKRIDSGLQAPNIQQDMQRGIQDMSRDLGMPAPNLQDLQRGHVGLAMTPSDPGMEINLWIYLFIFSVIICSLKLFFFVVIGISLLLYHKKRQIKNILFSH